jgi:hypothetical protein
MGAQGEELEANGVSRGASLCKGFARHVSSFSQFAAVATVPMLKRGTSPLFAWPPQG